MKNRFLCRPCTTYLFSCKESLISINDSFSDNFNLDGSQRPDYSNEAFGRFAAIDSIVAEGRFRMAAMVKVGVQKIC